MSVWKKARMRRRAIEKLNLPEGSFSLSYNLPWLDEEQTKNYRSFLDDIQREIDEQEQEAREFQKKLVEAARREIKKTFDKPFDPDTTKWDSKELAMVLHFSLMDPDDVSCGLFSPRECDPIARILDVEVPESLKELEDPCYKTVFGRGGDMMKKLDAIIKHFNIEVPESDEA